jgi:hypothetical protein
MRATRLHRAWWTPKLPARTDDAPLKQRECRLYGIRVQVTNAVLTEAVSDGFVLTKYAGLCLEDLIIHGT